MNTFTEKDLEIFCSLIMSYLLKKIHVSTFEKKYMSLWRNYRDNKSKILLQMNQVYGSAFDRIFTTLDVYNPDPKLRDEYEIDEEQLRQEVKEQLLKVKPKLEI